MPQININEFDLSKFTRVVTDNKVRVLIPGIASFGPIYDGTDDTDVATTFTDTTEFDRVYGYTEPEFNPFKNDVSRIYAKQLIQRGAAVTFVRLNDGTSAAYNMGEPLPESDVTGSEYPDAVKFEINEDSVNNPDFKTIGEDNNKEVARDINKKVLINKNALYKYRFCPQIKSITAKYPGSFGNNLLVTFTPIKNTNVKCYYQYSNVVVYRADVKTNVTPKTTTDSATNTATTEYILDKKILSVHKLESHRVSTNPNDANYFENVEFEYIKIIPTETAFDELSVIWSNLNGEISSNSELLSGFPEIPLRYNNGEFSQYNADALLSGGSDFNYGESLLNKLQMGYNRLDFADGEKSIDTVNEYIYKSYHKDDGIIYEILSNLKNIYKNYSDPYIYDFDFITSGGFINDEYTLNKFDETTESGLVKINDSEFSNVYETDVTTGKKKFKSFGYKIIAISKETDKSNSEFSVDIPEYTQPIHEEMIALAEKRKDCIALIDSGPYWNKDELTKYVDTLNTSYGTMHAPWCYCNDINSRSLVLMPPSFVCLYTMLSDLINNVDSQKWFPPAGVDRATARVVKKPLYEIGSVLLDKWQNNTLRKINPIMKLKNYGYVIYGQSTAYVAEDEYTHSALESLNVRLISNCVKKQIFNTCIKLAFEPNNSTLWMKFYDAMDKYLLFMKRNGGLYGYKIQMDEGTVTTDDINELRCPGKVWISPTRTAEDFDIDFILTDAGVTFSDTESTEEGE